jgi:hypothetical protein
MREAAAAERGRRGRRVQCLGEITEIRRLDSWDIDLHDFRDVIRMGLFQVPKESPHPFGNGLEEHDDLGRGFAGMVPPKVRLDRPVTGARREATSQDLLDSSLRDLLIRERHEHESHRAGRLDRIGRVGGHPSVPPT